MDPGQPVSSEDREVSNFVDLKKKGLKWKLGLLLGRLLLRLSAGLSDPKSTTYENASTELNKRKPRWRSRLGSLRKR